MGSGVVIVFAVIVHAIVLFAHEENSFSYVEYQIKLQCKVQRQAKTLYCAYTCFLHVSKKFFFVQKVLAPLVVVCMKIREHHAFIYTLLQLKYLAFKIYLRPPTVNKILYKNIANLTTI